MEEVYAIKVITPHPGLPPQFLYEEDGCRLRHFSSRQVAETYLSQVDRLPGHYYSVVYVREYFNQAQNFDGNYTRSTAAEIPEA